VRDRVSAEPQHKIEDGFGRALDALAEPECAAGAARHGVDAHGNAAARQVFEDRRQRRRAAVRLQLYLVD
jgi:hypothetical protein